MTETTSAPQMVNLKLYDHKSLDDGLRCYFITGRDKKLVELFNPANLQIGKVEAAKVEAATVVDFKVKAVRANLIAKIELAKRQGRAVPQQAIEILSGLGVAAAKVEAVAATPKAVEVAERCAQALEAARQNKILQQAIYDQNVARLMVERVKVDETKAEAAKAAKAKAANGGFSPNTKLELAIAMLCSEGGCTHAETQPVVGWKTVNWSKLADRVEIVRTVKEGARTRFFGRRVVAK